MMAENTSMEEPLGDGYNTVESLHLPYASSQCKVIITEIPEELNETKLYFYFRKKSSEKLVTDINDFEIDRGRQIAHLIFEDREIAAELESHNPHVIAGYKINLKCMDEPTIATNVLLLTELPETVDEYELTIYMDCLTYMDNEADKYCIIEIQYLSRGTVAKITFIKELNVDDLLKKINSTPYGKGIYITAERVPVSTCVIVENLPPSCTKMLLEFYFGNKKESGIDSVHSVELINNNTALIDVGTEERVTILMERRHVKLGPEVVLHKYDPLFNQFNQPLVESEDLLSSTIPNEPFQKFLSQRMAKYIASKLDALNSILLEYCANISVTEEGVIVSPTAGNENISTWQDVCSTKLNSWLQKLKEAAIEINPSLAIQINDLIANASNASDIVFELIINKLYVTGDSNQVDELITKVQDFQAEEQIETETVSLEMLHLIFIMNICGKDLQDEYPHVEFTSKPESGVIEITGKKCNREEFIEVLNKQKYFHKEIYSESEYYNFLCTEKGEKLVSDCITDLESITTFLDPVTEKFYVVGFPKNQVEMVERIIKKRIMKDKVPFPSQFERVCQEPSWKKRQNETETLCNVCITMSPESQCLCIVGDSSNFHSAKTQIVDYIREECHGKCRILLETGQWKLMSEGTLNQKWSGLVSKMYEHNISLQQPNKEDQDPVLLLEGDARTIQEFEKQIKDLVASVYSSSIVFARPGGARFFTSQNAKATLIGIEKMEMSCIDIKVRADKHKFTTKKMQEMCTAHTAEGKAIILIKGDITECSVDVIVNAANGELNHMGGVAAAIVRKGGKIIQEESQQYYLRNGMLNDGEAVLMKQVGNLPCQCIIHAVGPKWKNGQKKEYEILKSACFISLNLAREFHSIAFPAISAGIYGFPMQKCANCLIESFVVWSKNNVTTALKQMYVVVDSSNAIHAFTEAIKQQLQDSATSSISVNKELKKSTRHKVPLLHRSRKTNDRNASGCGRFVPFERDTLIEDLQYASKFINLLSGELLKHSADVYVNTASDTLSVSDGAVAKSLGKAGGKPFQLECSKFVTNNGNVPYGQIVVTSGGNIPCKCIVHAVGENYNSSQPQYSIKQLETLVMSSLAEADKHQAMSIAFPAIGTGNLHFPSHVVARVMVGTISNYLKSHQGKTCIETVKLVIYMKEVYKEFEKVLAGSSVQQSYRSVESSNTIRYKSSTYKPLLETSTIANHYLKVGNLLVEIVRGDITEDDSDVIVCATNRTMRLGGKVAFALSTKAGPKLQEYLDEKCTQGIELEEEKVISLPSLGSLKCKFIYFVMTPENRKVDTLSKTITACLKKAESNTVSSIAIPAIGTGTGNLFDPESAVQAISDAVVKYGFSSKYRYLKQVRIFAFVEKIYTLFLEKCNKVYKTSSQPGWLGFGWFSGRSSHSPELNRHQFSEADYYRDVVPSTTPHEILSSDIPSSTENYADKMVAEEVIIKIFAESSQKVENTKVQIQQFIDSWFSTDNFYSDNVKKMSDDDVEYLKNLSMARQVEFKYQPEIDRIVLKGTKDAIGEMKEKVYEVCHKITADEETEKVAKVLNESISWKYYDYNKYNEYDNPIVNSQIEEAYQIFKSGGSSNFSYHFGYEINHVDFTTMTETLHDGTVYDIKRFVTASDEVPPSWGPMPLDSMGKEIACHLVELQTSDFEYQEVADAFTNTMPPPGSSGSIVWNSITKIQRIQNPMLYAQYFARKKSMDKDNEKRLFHGCSSNVVTNICHQGFNRSFAGEHATVYGAGAYFAVRAEYSARSTYSPPDNSGNRFIFYARVLTGEYTVGKKGLRTPPSKDPTNKDVLYDSVVDRINNPDMFVVFQDAQSYPEYLITFK